MSERKSRFYFFLLIFLAIYFFIFSAVYSRAAISPEIALASFPAKKIIKASVDLFAEEEDGDFFVGKNCKGVEIVVFFKTIKLNISLAEILGIEVYTQKIVYGDSIPADNYKMEETGIEFETPGCFEEIVPVISSEIRKINPDKFVYSPEKNEIIIPIGATIDRSPLEFYKGRIEIIIYLK